MKSVLIVEDDLGFVFWLGGVLAGAGYQALPACSVSKATELVEEAASPIDLLIVDPSLPGVSRLIANLRRSAVALKVIALRAEVKTKLRGVNAWRPKSGPAQDPAKQKREWLEAVKDVLIRHKHAA